MKQLKVGVIGCGLIGQHMHLPYLAELEDRYQIHALCDLSQDVVERMGKQYHVSRCYTDYRELLASDVDAVMVLLSVPAGEVCVAAAQAGKHLFVEKPLAYSVQEAEEIIQSAEKAGVTLMVGYMKRYDPGYLYGQPLLQAIQHPALIRSHDVLGPLSLTLDEVHTIYRSNDIPDSAKQHAAEITRQRLSEAIGEQSKDVVMAYRILLGLSSHDMTVLRGAFGDPKGVIAFDLWDGGRSYAAILDYGDKGRAIHEVAHMAIKKFDEELVAYDDHGMVRIAFPNPYLKHAPTTVTVWEMDGTAYAEREVIASYDEAFRRELIHFHECVTEGKQPLTTGREAQKDVALSTELIQAYLRRQGR